MTVELRVATDPACPWSWASEPKLRRLLWELGDAVDPRWVMGGMARSIGTDEHPDRIATWLQAAGESRMPLDPRLWTQGGISSSYPACQAIVAACEQGPEAAGRYLRRIREGLMVERKRLDHAEALIAEAGAAGLDVARFEVDLRSNAVLEAFGAHLEEVRRVPVEAREQDGVGSTGEIERVSFPSLSFVGEDGARHGVYGWQPYERYLEAAAAAGVRPAERPRPSPLEVVERFGRCATREVEEVTGRPRVVVEAELWGLAREWRLRAVPVLTGTLWELA